MSDEAGGWLKLNDGDKLSLRIRSAFQRFDAEGLTRLLHLVDPAAGLSSESLERLATRLAEPAWSRAAIVKLDPAAMAALRLLARLPHEVEVRELDQASRLIAAQAEGATSPSLQLLNAGIAITWPVPQIRMRERETRIRVLGPLRERWLTLVAERLPEEHPVLQEGEETFHVLRTEFLLGVTLAVLEQLRPRSTRFGDMHRSDARVVAEKLTSLAGSEAAALQLIRQAARLELLHVVDGRLKVRTDGLARWDDPLSRMLVDEIAHRRTSSAWRAAFAELYTSESWVPRSRLLEVALLALFELRNVSFAARAATNALQEISSLPGVLTHRVGGIAYLRLSEAVRRVIAGQHSGVAGGARLLVQPNLEIVAQPGTPLRVLARLGSFCRLKNADAVAVFALDEPTMRRSAGEGVTSAEILRLLEENSTHGVPSTVARAITDWARTRASATLVTGAVALVDLPVHEIREIAGQIPVDEVAPGVFVVHQSDRNAFAAALRKAGVACRTHVPLNVEDDELAPDEDFSVTAGHEDGDGRSTGIRFLEEFAQELPGELSRLLRVPGD